MHRFEAQEVVATGDQFVIWRRPTLVAMQVFGAIDDARSEIWQAALANEFATRQYPRFYAMDVSKVDATLSMAGRYRTVSFVRNVLSKIEWAALLARGRPGPVPIVRALLRVISMPNITLCVSEAVFRLQVDAMLAGELPPTAIARWR